MENPTISVIVPAYNAEAFVERTLRSALSQSIAAIEVIIINDGSTDRTPHICKSVAAEDGRIKVVDVANGGVARARNLGLQIAKGEFVAFLDADDLWHPSKLGMQLDAIRTSGAAAAYALSRLIGVHDQVTGSQGLRGESGYTLARHMYAKPVGNGSALLVRRDVALEVGDFDPSWAAREIGGCEDLDFELKIMAKYGVVVVPLYLIGYREYPGNMSSNKYAMAQGIVGVVEKHINLNNSIPAWAERLILSKTLEYSSKILFGSRNKIILLNHLFRLSKYDLICALEQISKSLLRKLKWWIPHRARDKASTVRGVQFCDADPGFGVASLTNTKPRELKALSRLAQLDATLQMQQRI